MSSNSKLSASRNPQPHHRLLNIVWVCRFDCRLSLRNLFVGLYLCYCIMQSLFVDQLFNYIRINLPLYRFFEFVVGNALHLCVYHRKTLSKAAPLLLSSPLVCHQQMESNAIAPSVTKNRFILLLGLLLVKHLRFRHSFLIQSVRAFSNLASNRLLAK